MTASLADYPIFTMMEAPEIETVILETQDRQPSGTGEPPIGPIAPAIGNALFALTGVRVRRLPMTQEHVRIAFQTEVSIRCKSSHRLLISTSMTAGRRSTMSTQGKICWPCWTVSANEASKICSFTGDLARSGSLKWLKEVLQKLQGIRVSHGIGQPRLDR